MSDFTCAANSVECATNNCTATSSIAAGRRRLAAAEDGFTGRRLLACSTACLGPKIDGTALASNVTYISTAFSAPYAGYSGASNGYSMAFGICYQQNGGNFTATSPCNYRNVTVLYVTGDTAGKQSFVYAVTFWQLPANAAQLAIQTASLVAALPSTDTTAVGSVAYGMYATSGGALSTLSGVTLGTGGYAAPPMTSPPPHPPLPPYATPPPPAPSPPASPPPPSPIYSGLTTVCNVTSNGAFFTLNVKLVHCNSIAGGASCASLDNYCLLCADGSALGFNPVVGTDASCLAIPTAANINNLYQITTTVAVNANGVCTESLLSNTCMRSYYAPPPSPSPPPSPPTALVYPPGTGMLGGNTVTITAPYGSGVYIASASSEYGSNHCSGGYGESAWQPFNLGGPFCSWTPSQSSLYCGTDTGCSNGAYFGSASTTIASSAVPGDPGVYPQTSMGEWVQLNLPAAVTVVSYNISGNPTSGRSPSQWALLCQPTAGAGWTLLDSQNMGQAPGVWPWASVPQSLRVIALPAATSCLNLRIVLNKNSPPYPGACCDNGWIGLWRLTFGAY